MRNRALISSALIGSLSLAPLVSTPGCAKLPGNSKTQGAAIGGLGGALAGAAIGSKSKSRAGVGALIGGLVGAGGGYLIGAQKEKLDQKKKGEAEAAHRRAEQNPARPEDVEKARTADLNDDGFVTLDEVVAMERSNLSDREMVERLDRTGQVFELTEEQERYLEDRGVSHAVILEMRRMNADDTDYARTASAGGADYDSSVKKQSDTERRRTGDRDRPRDFERYREPDDRGDFDRF
jgi:hypothetical protein